MENQPHPGGKTPAQAGDLTPYGVAVEALEDILELDTGSASFEDARAIASRAHFRAIGGWRRLSQELQPVDAGDTGTGIALYLSAIARLSAGLREVQGACQRGDASYAVAPIAAAALADVDRLQIGLLPPGGRAELRSAVMAVVSRPCSSPKTSCPYCAHDTAALMALADAYAADGVAAALTVGRPAVSAQADPGTPS